MTHNKYFFSGRLEEVRAKPGGGNVQQTYVHESDPAGPHEKDVVPLASTADPFGNPSYNLNPMLLEAIRMSDPFWDLSKHTQFSAVIDAIYYEVHYATPWVPGTHKANKAVGMQSTVRGVSNAGTPGLAYTFLLKLYIMKLTVPQVKSMLDHADSAYIRCLGFLYLRIGAESFKELWTWFEPYLADTEEFTIDGTPATKTTIGEYVRRLLTDQDYFGDRLPRIPVALSRAIASNLEEWSVNQASAKAEAAAAARTARAPPAPPAADSPAAAEGRRQSGGDERRGRSPPRNREGGDRRRRRSPSSSEERSRRRRRDDSDERPRKRREGEEGARRRRRDDSAEDEKEKARAEARAEARKRREAEEAAREAEREARGEAKRRLKKKRAELAAVENKVKELRRSIAEKEEAELAARGAASVGAGA